MPYQKARLLDSEAFESMREDFNTSLNRLLTKLTRRRDTVADITLKLSVCVMKEQGTDEDTGEVVQVYTPFFDYTVTTALTEKDKHKGSAAKGKYRMRYDEENDTYLLVPFDNGQTTLF